MKRLAKVSLGAAPITEEAWNPRLEVDVVNSLIYRLRQAGIPEDEMPDRVRTFLYSDSALDVPFNKISSLLFAALARKAAAGQRKVPSPGTWNDIQMISAFLPYCDAMFVDNQFAGLLDEEPLSSRIQYPTTVFSSRTRDEFLEYLRDIEASVSPDHRELVETVYGPDWEQPFREILAAERGRSAENSEEPE